VGFEGEIAAVNPRHRKVHDVVCYKRLQEVPFTPDAVLVGVGREHVLQVLQDAAETGAGGAVVFAGGFAEADATGQSLQDELVAVARRSGMAILGPNCQGILSPGVRSALYLDPVLERLRPGRAALVSQSGAVVTALVNNNRGLHFSHLISSGNEAVVDAAACIEYFARDESTAVILAFLEAINSPQMFFAACDAAAAAGKPVVVLKSGRSERSRIAAMAHTGALALPDRLVDALFRRYGVQRVGSLEELIEVASAFLGRAPKGPRVGVVTLSGAQVGLVADELAQTRLELPAFSEPTEIELRRHLYSFRRPSNPLDVWGPNLEAFDRSYRSSLETVANDPCVDIVVAVAETTHTYRAVDSAVLETVVRAVESARPVGQARSHRCESERQRRPRPG
jgi:acetyltransferase